MWYYNKWVPRLFYKKYDGGKESGVTGYFLIEWKVLFSIGLLHFKEGSRENYHSHAFNACTWWLKGLVDEETWQESGKRSRKTFFPGSGMKFTPRSKIHKVIAYKNTWALTFRGPWNDTWQEITPKDDRITLTHGRKVVNSE